MSASLTRICNSYLCFALHRSQSVALLKQMCIASVMSCMYKNNIILQINLVKKETAL